MSSPINVTYVTPGAIISVAVVFPVLGTLCVGLRIYVRRVQKARILADDWLLLPALVGPLSMTFSKILYLKTIDMNQALIIGMGIALIIGEIHVFLLFSFLFMVFVSSLFTEEAQIVPDA